MQAPGRTCGKQRGFVLSLLCLLALGHVHAAVTQVRVCPRMCNGAAHADTVLPTLFSARNPRQQRELDVENIGIAVQRVCSALIRGFTQPRHVLQGCIAAGPDGAG